MMANSEKIIVNSEKSHSKGDHTHNVSLQQVTLRLCCFVANMVVEIDSQEKQNKDTVHTGQN